jgi:hypothetical protein
MLTSDRALKPGMVDRVDTLERTINRLAWPPKRLAEVSAISAGRDCISWVKSGAGQGHVVRSHNMSMLALKQKVYNVISAHLRHREFSRGDVLEYIDQDYPDTNHGSVLPSDYLYDDAIKSSPSNKRHDNYDLPRFLKRLGRQ